MEVEQARLYRGTLDDLVTDVEKSSETEFAEARMTFLARRARLLQICSNPSAVEPGYAGTPAKLAAIDSLLAQTVAETGEKVIIWSFYTASISALMARYAKYGAV